MDALIEFVKERRKSLGLTQRDLADRAGVGLRFIRELEQVGKAILRHCDNEGLGDELLGKGIGISA